MTVASGVINIIMLDPTVNTRLVIVNIHMGVMCKPGTRVQYSLIMISFYRSIPHLVNALPVTFMTAQPRLRPIATWSLILVV